MWNCKTIKVEGTNHFVRERLLEKEAETICFIHGLGWTGEIWSSAAKFMEGYQLIAPDLPGHGESDPTNAYDYHTLAEQLHSLMKEMKVERPILVGSSWGAGVVVKYASLYPDHVDRVVLLDDGYYPIAETPGLKWEMIENGEFPAEALKDLDSYYEFMKSDNPQFWNQEIEKAVRDQITVKEDGKVAFKAKDETQLACMKAAWDFDPLAEENRLTVPSVLLIAHSLNEDEERRRFKRVKANDFYKLNNGYAIEMEETDHLIMLDKPMELVKVIRDASSVKL
ncbi:alpha/beta fold hydrolase [Falsibacillus pallidus]|uniref:Pimeloyl-ACP methyl ester carboxylesterase n=1 Tax=Falsibacillus pallidus TaxID=493781 RepID=A0A370GST3_9BACI|nr:alpha/beta hydrolase [Falsibacillus pallidus]RDI45584.1 pimeloyl-ACP methyl ester carboxylesterase [Falsibacillus pallidus]